LADAPVSMRVAPFWDLLNASAAFWAGVRAWPFSAGQNDPAPVQDHPAPKRTIFPVLPLCNTSLHDDSGILRWRKVGFPPGNGIL
tara:strand:- start:57 stop:311 length:255 start_codon:yes stop_codon:yes gene_type:complete